MCSPLAGRSRQPGPTFNPLTGSSRQPGSPCSPWPGSNWWSSPPCSLLGRPTSAPHSPWAGKSKRSSPLQAVLGQVVANGQVGQVLRMQSLSRQKQAAKSYEWSLGRQKQPAKSSMFLGNHQLHHQFITFFGALIIQHSFYYSLTYSYFPHAALFFAFLQFK